MGIGRAARGPGADQGDRPGRNSCAIATAARRVRARACVPVNACGSSSGSRTAQACRKHAGTSTRRGIRSKHVKSALSRLSQWPRRFPTRSQPGGDRHRRHGARHRPDRRAAGIRVLLHDSRPGAAREAKDPFPRSSPGSPKKGRLDREAVARAEATSSSSIRSRRFSSCPIVIEAVAENLETSASCSVHWKKSCPRTA